MSAVADSLISRLDETRQRWWMYSMLCNILLVLFTSIGTLTLFILLDVLLQLPQLWLGVLAAIWLLVTVGLIVQTIYRVMKLSHFIL